MILLALFACYVGPAGAAPQRCDDLETPKDFSRLAHSAGPAASFAANFLEFSRWRERRDLPNSMARNPGEVRPNPSARMRVLLPKLDIGSPDNARVLGCAIAQSADDALTRSAIEVVARKAPRQVGPLARDYATGDAAKAAEIEDVLAAVKANPIRP